MAEPFTNTPASRVFGMGLPRRSNLPLPTSFGRPIFEERRNLSPMARQSALIEQQLEAQESALAAQQAKQEAELQGQEMVMQGQEAMGRAFADLEQGEDIENIFRKNPAIVFSPQFGEFSQAAQFMQPSRAAKTLAPSLAKDLPGQYRSKYFELLNTPQYANDPLGAKTVIDTEMGIDEQRGRLAKVGIPLGGERKLLSPEEEEGLIFQHTAKKSDPQIAAMEKYLERLQKKRDSLEAAGKDQIPNPLASDEDPTIPKYIPSPEYENLEKEITDVDAQYGARMRGIFMPKTATTAEDITSPAATGGALAAAPAPLKDTMAKLSGGGAPVVTDLTPDELVKEIDNNKTDPVFLMGAINSPQRDEKSKDVAFKYLQDLQKDPTKIRFSEGTPDEVRQAKQNIQKTIELYPALKETNRAWTTEKQKIEKAVEEFAIAKGVSNSLMNEWLKSNVDLDRTAGSTVQEGPKNVSVRDAFNRFLHQKTGLSLSDNAPILTKVAQKYPKRIKDLGLDRWFGLTMGEVLDSYLGEQAPEQPQNQVAPQTSNANVARMPKIQIGTPIQTTR